MSAVGRHVTATIADAAAITGVPAGTIRRWLAEGRLRKLGDHKPWRVDLAEISDLSDTLGRARLARTAVREQ